MSGPVTKSSSPQPLNCRQDLPQSDNSCLSPQAAAIQFRIPDIEKYRHSNLSERHAQPLPLRGSSVKLKELVPGSFVPGFIFINNMN